MTWLTRTLSGLWGYVGVAFGALAILVGAYFKGQKAGKDAVKAKQAKKAVKASKKANAIRDKNTAAAESDLDKRLRKYQRK